MTTGVTNTVIAQTTNTQFQTWIAEVITMLFTTLGLTQTADTGQINTSTVTIPGSTNTSAGYVIGRFNDTAQSTTPIFFKLEFGTASSTTGPSMWITVGTASNGSGTISANASTRVVLCPNSNTPSSTVTPYLFRACYNTTDGFLWFGWKMNGTGTSYYCMAGLILGRTNDTSGNPTTDAFFVMSNAAGASGSSSYGYMQVYSNLTSTMYNSGVWPQNYWIGCFPFNLTTTLYSGNAQVLPAFQYTPVIGFSNYHGIALQGELPQGATASMTLVGSTAHTYIGFGSIFAVSAPGAASSISYGSTTGTVNQFFVWE